MHRTLDKSPLTLLELPTHVRLLCVTRGLPLTAASFQI